MQLLELCVARGADVLAKDGRGKLPMDVAKDSETKSWFKQGRWQFEVHQLDADSPWVPPQPWSKRVLRSKPILEAASATCRLSNLEACLFARASEFFHV